MELFNNFENENLILTRSYSFNNINKLKNMKKSISPAFIFVIIFTAITLTFASCGPSAEQRRQQEIKDSLQLEKDRRDLLDRAGKVFETPADTAEQMAGGDTL